MRPSVLVRVLLRAIRGPGSEYLLGDLDEWWLEEQARRARGGRRRSHALEVLRSAISWWAPGSVARRRRNGGSPREREGVMGWMREVRLAIRSLVRRPSYAALVIGVMGIGIGATTTVLTIVDRVLLRPLPHPEADRLVVIGNTFPGREWQEGSESLQHLAGFSLANFLDWTDRARSFESMAALEQLSILLPDEGSGPELAASSAVTPELFTMLAVRPALGRVFHPDEYRAAAPEVMMLSWDAWQTRYGGDPNVVGAARTAVGRTSEIVGVLPQGFEIPEVMGRVNDFWFPIRLDSDRYSNRGRRSLFGLALLQPGISLEAARAEMSSLADQLAIEFPDGNVYPDGQHLGAGANSLQSHTIGTTARPIALFMGAALILLVIAGLNTANLVLVRGLSRTHEIGVRRALGASQGRLVRLLIVETLILALLGGAVGILLGTLGIEGFRAWGPSTLPRMDEIALDGRVLLMATAVTLGCGLITGLIPAWRLTGRRGSGVLPGPGRVFEAGAGWPWTVSAQVALSVLLMVAAGLLMESFIRIRTFDPGFEPTNALTFRQGLKRPGTEDVPLPQLWDEVIQQVEATGAYGPVAAASNLPYQSPNWAPWVLLPDDAVDFHRSGTAGYVVTHDFLETAGIPVLEGRGFDASDDAQGRRVAVVNRAFVEVQMGGGSAVGTMLRFREGEELDAVEVVGVVGDAVQGRPEEGLLPAVYVPYTQSDWPSIWVFARSSGDPLAGVDAVRRGIAQVNPYVPPLSIASMTERIGRTRTGPRFNAALALAFGLVSLLLSAGGLYGALSFAVGRRTKELGVRIALGADRASLLGLVLKRGLQVTGLGILAGLVGALVASRAITGFLFEVRPTSPGALVAATAVLVGVAAAASLAPALRAARVDPVTSLSAE